MDIEWNPPEPRTGLAGQWDRFMGPGATDAEQWLMLIPSLLMTIGVLIHAYVNQLGWSGWQYLAAAIMAFDITGGVITNATATTKRWYHRAGQTNKHLLSFTAVHIIHLLLVAWLFRQGDWVFLAMTYGYLWCAAIVILKAPLYLQRPFAMLGWMGGLLISLYVFSPTPGLEWFLPFFYAKLLVCHLVKEAPFSPPARDGGIV